MRRARPIPAQRLASDFGSLLGDFTDEVGALLTQPALAESGVPVAHVRREVCAAVWAAILAAFDASVLSAEEKAALSPLLQEKLIPLWEKHCASDPDVIGYLSERAAFYMQGRDPASQVATASVIVRRLLDEAGAVGETKRQLALKLIPLFAHRMLGDRTYIDDLKTRVGIQLPSIAALLLTAGLAGVVDGTLKMLRLT
jgi:hypothetical protein